MGFKGIDVRQSGDRIVFRASLKDSSGVKVTSGATTLALYELQNDGTLKSYDWNSNTFKTTALTTPTLGLTHRTGNNATVNTGIWTGILTTLTGFTRGNIYLAQVNNSGASPVDQEREFQFGEGEGDFAVNTSGRVDLGTWLGSAPNALSSGSVDAGQSPLLLTTEPIKGATTSKVIYLPLVDAVTGARKTGIAFGSVTARYSRDATSSAAITVVAGTDQTYINSGAAGTGGGWIETPSHAGIYQFSIPTLTLGGGEQAIITISATGCADTIIRIPIVGMDLQDSMRGGMRCLPATQIPNPGSSLLTFGSGSGEINAASGKVTASACDLLIAFDPNVLGQLLQEDTVAEEFAITTNSVAGQIRALILTRLGTPAGASVSVDVAAIKTDTGNLLTRIPAALFAGMTSLAKWLRAAWSKTAADATAVSEINAAGLGSGAGTFVSSTDALEALRDEGDAAWVTGSGTGLTGARLVTITVNDGSAVIQGAKVRVTSSTPETDIKATDASGVVSFNLDNGSWSVRITKAGYTFSPVTLTVNSDTTQTYSMALVVVTPATDPSQTNAYLTTYDGHGSTQASVTISFRLLSSGSGAGHSHPGKPFTAVSNGSGLLQVTLEQGTSYEAQREAGRWVPFTTTLTPTYQLPEVLGGRM